MVAVSPAQARPSPSDTRPDGSGLAGFCFWSGGRSTRSLTAPIDACSNNIETASRRAVAGPAPASIATPPVAAAFMSDGKAWLRRTSPIAVRIGPGLRAASDVDELAEVGDEVLDEPAATVGHEAADAGNERPQADRRHDEAALRVAPERRRR